MSSKAKYITRDIEELLETKYSPPRHAFMTQVPNGTGDRKSRTADAIAVGCWSGGDGISISGFEIKVSRSDWLSEIQKPQKAEAFTRYCHRWYVVAPKGVVKTDEMPASWGLMHPTKAGLRIASAADLTEPEPIPTSMLAAMLRRAMYCNRSAADQSRAVNRSYDEGYRAGIEQAKSESSARRRSTARMEEHYKRQIEEFEEASGVKITGWQRGNIAEAVALLVRVQELDLKGIIQGAEMIATAARELAAVHKDER